MSRTGLFLVLEGGEGVGKTTHALLLAQWFASLGLAVTRAREPGGTRLGEAIREVLLHHREMEIPPESELLLMLAARAAFVREVVRPALARGEIMLADRFEYSTFVYQGLGRGLGLDRARDLNAFATGGIRPDLVVVLDLPPSGAAARRRSAGRADDRIEGEGEAFLTRIHAGYRVLAEGDPDAVVVDAEGTPEEVQARIRSVLRVRFPEPFGSTEG
ncbi:MAG: dTMP kinase [Gemmatimonadales bacterium]|nr:MAG: dTMP kinase [Gemmatimonadales bacterium]